MVKFEDFQFLTHQIYNYLETEIEANVAQLTTSADIQIREAIVRLYRAKYNIDFLI
jgi:hypothetical protein